ncbi:MAG: NTF2 fold immunity protein [Bacteroidota bacterium]
MTHKYILIFCLFFSIKIFCFGQEQGDRLILGEGHAKKQLQLALSDTTIHNVVNPQVLILKDKEAALNVIEPILFGIYSKGNIIKQRPYEVYMIDNYWVISGTLPKGYKGGCFLIIVDATNSKIVRLTHGK